MEEDQREPARRVVLLLALVGGLGLLAIVLALLAPLAPTAVDLAQIDQVLMVERRNLRPEPLEQFLYVVGVLLLPWCLVLAYRGARRFEASAGGRRLMPLLASPASWLPAPLALLLLCAAGLADDRTTLRLYLPGGAISPALAALLAAGTVAAGGGRLPARARRLLRVLLPGLAGLLFLGILLFSILGPEHMRNWPVFWASFNAVFYSVVQVFFGRQLLVDFTNQYGLYPHFIEPAFRLVGLSVYTFTALMGLLTCLAFGCLYRFLAQESDDELLAFLGLATIVYFGYVAGRVKSLDLFLQYHPIRLLFPAVSLLVVRAFAHGPAPRLSLLLIALGSAAALWNPDSGLVVLAAGFLLLVYDALLRRRPGQIPGRLFLGAAAAAAVVLACSIFLRLRYGDFPDYTRLLLHSKAFYLSGAMMLPMPPFGLWVPVLVVYAAGLLLSLAALVEGDDTPRARIWFYLSVLGFGLFTYYQGRSALGNLMAAGYPAVLLVVLAASDLLRRPSPPLRGADRLLGFTLLALLCYSLPALATVAPDWVRGIAWKLEVTKSGEEGQVYRDAKFLRDHVRPGQELVILSYNSGFHHLVSQTTNPLDIPGDSELIYRADYEKQRDYLRHRRGTFVIDSRTLVPNYVAEACDANPGYVANPNGTLILFPVP